MIQRLSFFAEKMRLEKKIVGWFFIRYQDPERHLRFRMRLINEESLSGLLLELHKTLKEWLSENLIKEALFANYERELERYGGPELIEAAEYLFCLDSLSIVHLLERFPPKILPEPILHATSLIRFLKGFRLRPSEMIDMFSVDDRSELKGFREHKSQLISLVEALDGQIENEETESFFQAEEMRREAQDYFYSQVQDLSRSAKYTIFNSLLHMHANRLGCSVPNEKKARLYAAQALSAIKNKTLRYAETT